jgi:hypothetical protein
VRDRAVSELDSAALVVVLYPIFYAVQVILDRKFGWPLRDVLSMRDDEYSN